MSTVRDCPACGRGHIKGRRVLVPTRDGRLIRKLVCLQCASRAERILTVVSAKSCMVSECPEAAHVCTKHVAEAVTRERESSLAIATDTVRAMLRALKLVAEREPDAHEFLMGKVEGIESALEVLERKGIS